MTETREYLETMVNLINGIRMPKSEGFLKYNCVEAYVLDKGTQLSKEPYTPDEEVFLTRLFSAHSTPVQTKSCFETAYKLALLADFFKTVWWPEAEIYYGEGFGNNQLIPVQHAVLVLNDKPVDLVWREDMLVGNSAKSPKNLLKRAKWTLSSCDYYMVKFPYWQASDLLMAKGSYGLIDDYQHQYPLLRADVTQ